MTFIIAILLVLVLWVLIIISDTFLRLEKLVKEKNKSEQETCDAAAAILKKRTGNKTFEIELGEEK